MTLGVILYSLDGCRLSSTSILVFSISKIRFHIFSVHLFVRYKLNLLLFRFCALFYVILLNGLYVCLNTYGYFSYCHIFFHILHILFIIFLMSVLRIMFYSHDVLTYIYHYVGLPDLYTSSLAFLAFFPLFCCAHVTAA